MPIRRNLEFHELSGKQNLVTLTDGCGCYDKFKCLNCGKEIRIYGICRTRTHPGPCYVGKAKYEEVMEQRKAKIVASGEVYGTWSTEDCPHKCGKCEAIMILCPREGHPNSKFWVHERDDGMVLKVCPNNCPADA